MATLIGALRMLNAELLHGPTEAVRAAPEWSPGRSQARVPRGCREGATTVPRNAGNCRKCLFDVSLLFLGVCVLSLREAIVRRKNIGKTRTFPQGIAGPCRIPVFSWVF